MTGLLAQHGERLNWREIPIAPIDRVVSAIACSIKGNVKRNISPSTGSWEKFLDFQPPLQPRETLGSGVPLTAWLIDRKSVV